MAVEEMDLDPATERLSAIGPDYLLAMHIAACGNQAEDAGCDEKPVVMITAKLLDLSNQNLTGDEMQFVVNCNLSESSGDICTNEVQLSLGITDEDVLHASNLVQTIELIDKWLKDRNLHHISRYPQSGDAKYFQIIQDGYLAYRLVLHSDLTRCNFHDFERYPFLLEFIDVRKVFSRLFKCDTLQSLSGMFSHFQLPEPFMPRILRKQLSSWTSNSQTQMIDDTVDEEKPLAFGQWPLEHCRDLVRLAIKLSQCGETWTLSSYIQNYYQPALIKKTTPISDDVVVRARGLPWQATDNEIHEFLRGITIIPGGIALVLGKVGRRNGEAVIALANIEQRDLALRKHKHHIGSRYIEIYTALGDDFIDVAGGETLEAELFLSRYTSYKQNLVRIRGLPYNVTGQEILDFFATTNCTVQFGEEGILFVLKPDGKATGDAFVIFEDKEMAERALLSHRKHIGQRYIELFKSTPAEVHQVMNDTWSQETAPSNFFNYLLPNQLSQLTGQTGLMGNLYPTTNLNIPPYVQLDMFPNHFSTIPPPNMPDQYMDQGDDRLFKMNPNQLLLAKGYVKLKNIPNEVTVMDVLKFLDIYCQFVSMNGSTPLIYRKRIENQTEILVELVNETASLLVFTSKNFTDMFINATKRMYTVSVLLSTKHDLDFGGFTLDAAGQPDEQGQSFRSYYDPQKMAEYAMRGEVEGVNQIQSKLFSEQQIKSYPKGSNMIQLDPLNHYQNLPLLPNNFMLDQTMNFVNSNNYLFQNPSSLFISPQQPLPQSTQPVQQHLPNDLYNQSMMQSASKNTLDPYSFYHNL